MEDNMKAVLIPEHLLNKIKKREVTRSVFMDTLLAMEIGTMIEVPDTQYKHNTVRGRVSDANKMLYGKDKKLITTRQNGSFSTLILCVDI
jgi:hypothetical protein